MKRITCLGSCLGVLLGFGITAAATDQNRLPQDHDYQRTLRAYLASLAEKDLDIDVQPFIPPAPDTTLDELCRLWVLSQHVPSIGGVAAPSSQFMLAAIEGEQTVMRPPADSLSLAWLAGWDSPLNPYRGLPALQRRALVSAIVDLIMTDGLHECSPGKDWVAYGLGTGIREGRVVHSDCLGGTLIWLGYTYLKCREALPPEARAAYETGLIKLAHRLNDWGPTALMTDMDLFSSVSLAYIAQACDDSQVQHIADSYIRKLYTHPRFFSPAGYWVDIQGYDASYNGISFYFANWSALATGWDYVRQAVEKAYRLKAHLSLPEPGGGLIGPTHFSPRTSSDSANDQWNWAHRNTAGALITEEAAYLVNVPTDQTLRQTPEPLVASLNQTATSGANARAGKWTAIHWTHTLNFGFEHYPEGFHQRRRQLEKNRPEMLLPPFARSETFLRRFGEDFVIAKFADYGLVIHTGPVGQPEEDWPQRAQWMPREKPFGFSGGALSAFWTPAGGSMLLGRRGGAQGEVFDRYEEWRLWPIHAVTGQTTAGRVFTSGRILRPRLQTQVREDQAVVEVEGMIPRAYAGQGEALIGDLRYQRRFEFDNKGLRIETRVSGDGKDPLAELCETLPVFIAMSPPPEGASPVEIQFRTAGVWEPAGGDYRRQVEAVRIKRHTGIIHITFEKPQRVKLSPRTWSDQYQSRATCRTILIDLLAGVTEPFRQAAVRYAIAPVAE